MLYADDIVLVVDNWEELESRYTRWKKALQEKGMKINVNKTKAFYTRRNFVRMQFRKYPCRGGVLEDVLGLEDTF